MPIDSLGGYTSPFDFNEDFFSSMQDQASRQGPAGANTYKGSDNGLVARTMDTLNGMPSQNETATYASKQEFGAAVVSKTLDYMNAGNSGGSHNDYDFQKSVLNAYAAGKGTLAKFKA